MSLVCSAVTASFAFMSGSRPGVSEQTYYRWKAKFGGMEVSDAKKLRGLEDENRRLKTMVADQALDIQMLKAVVAKKW